MASNPTIGLRIERCVITDINKQFERTEKIPAKGKKNIQVERGIGRCRLKLDSDEA